jgi:hypothetical protein
VFQTKVLCLSGHQSWPEALWARYECSFCGEGGKGHIRSPEKDLEPIRF